MSVFPLNIPDKEDHPDKVAKLSGTDAKYYQSAEELNKKRDAINELKFALNAISQGAGTPFEDLTAAMVSPLADGQPFFTTVTDTGQYFYDSTTAEGYILDHLFVGEPHRTIFTDLADATSYWSAQDAAGNTPSNGVLIFIESLKEDYKWDSSVTAKAVETGRAFFKKAEEIATRNPDLATSGDTHSFVDRSLESKADTYLGVNIFNTSERVDGFFANYRNGVLTPNSRYSYLKVSLKPNTTYTISVDSSDIANIEQFAIMKKDDSFDFGNIAGEKSITFTTSANSYYGLFSLNNIRLDMLYMLEEGSARGDYKRYKKQIDIALLPILERKNIFDISKKIAGYFADYRRGVLTPNVGYSYLKVTLKPNTTYTISVDENDIANIEQFAIMKADNTFDFGNIAGEKSITFTTSANSRFGLFTINNIRLDMLYMLEVGNKRSNYAPYSYQLKQENAPFVYYNKLDKNLKETIDSIYKEIVYVSDFNNLREAVEYCTSTSYNYEVRIDEGYYDVLAMYTESEINDVSFKGLDIPQNVYLKGIGENANVHLHGELNTTTFTATRRNRVSTLNFIGSGGLENIKVTSFNIRYAVHDDVDYGNDNVVRVVRNCIIDKSNGDSYGQCYGGGTRSGGDYLFEYNTFNTDRVKAGLDQYPFSFHNNNSFDRKSRIVLKYNHFTSKTGKVACSFGYIASGKNDEIIMIGNTLNGVIQLRENSNNSGTGVLWDLKGSGNTKVPVKVIDSTGGDFTYNFTGETVLKNNGTGSIINANSLVKLTSNFDGVEPMTSSDSFTLFYGVALEDIADNGEGIVQYSNYLPIDRTSLTGLTIGDKIGVVSGSLAVVTGSNYIGIVSTNDFIRLIN